MPVRPVRPVRLPTLPLAAIAAVGLALGVTPRPGLVAPARASVEDAPGPVEPVVRVERTAEALLRAQPAKFASLVENAPGYRLQVVVAEVESGEGGAARLKRSAYRDGAEYFYPASAIKLCAATSALEKLAEMRKDEAGLSRTTPMRFYGDAAAFDADGGQATLAHEIRKAIIVSDNEAFNRLFTFVGHREINERLWKAGQSSVRVAHRLSAGPSGDDARVTGRVDLVLGDGRAVSLPRRVSDLAFDPAGPPAGLAVGSSYWANGKLVPTPMPFDDKNRVSLRDLQDVLVRVVRPELGGDAVPPMDDDDRRFLVDTLNTLPREWKGGPPVDPVAYPDGAYKPILPGLTRVFPRERLLVASKAGRAYGFTIENAYVEDKVTHRAFFLAAAIYTNSDEVMNDDLYDYGVASAFVADLGEAAARALLKDVKDVKDAP